MRPEFDGYEHVSGVFLPMHTPIALESCFLVGEPLAGLELTHLPPLPTHHDVVHASIVTHGERAHCVSVQSWVGIECWVGRVT